MWTNWGRKGSHLEREGVDAEGSRVKGMTKRAVLNECWLEDDLGWL